MVVKAVRKASRSDVKDAYLQLVDSWERSLRADNKSLETRESYLFAARELHRFLVGRRMPTALEALSREHIEEFVEDQLKRLKASSAKTRYRSLTVFFGWLVAEGELAASPMARMHPPAIGEDLKPVLSESEIDALLKTCAGRQRFTDVRDNAILRLMLDSGMRLSECSELKVDELDLTENFAIVRGKGRRQRMCPFGRKTSQALDRYKRARAKHRLAESEYLWVGQMGRLTASGLFQMVKQRGREAGLDIHPHLFRHTAAHRWMANDGGETDLMALLGWRSRTMLSRYGASAASERARAAHGRLGLMDRF